MKRVLIFAPYFLPRRRVGSMRPFRFVIHLREFGWEPTVLTIAAKGQRLTEKEARLLDGIDIVEIEPPFDRTVAAESQLGMSGKKGEARPGKRRFSLGLFDRQFPVDTWLLLFLSQYRKIAETVRRLQPDVIWSTGDPWSSLVVSERLARQFGIPWVADFRDPWTLCGVRTEGQWNLTKAIDRHYERRIIDTADVVLFQAKHTEDNYRAHYADLSPRTTTIYNSYDPAVFEDPVALEGYSPMGVSPGDDLEIGFFGRFRSMSPASVMADVLEVARRKHGALADGLRVYSFGPLSREDAQYAESRGVLHHFGQRDAVPLERSVAALRSFDLLLLSTDPKRDEIIPAKLFEYLAAARPILSLSRNPEVGDLLERTGAGIQPHLSDKEAIADFLAACLTAKREGRPMPVPARNAPEEISRFEARATTEELAALFDSIGKPAA